MKCNKIVFVINGRGGCGKDTLCDIVAKYYKTYNVSSITPIKELAAKAGWNGEKDPKSRKMLADLKQLFTEYNDLCNNYVLSCVDNFLESSNEIMFVHIREGKEIEKFVKFASEKCTTKTLLIERHTEDYSNNALGNASDDNVTSYNYDYKFINAATSLEKLESDFMEFFNKLV